MAFHSSSDPARKKYGAARISDSEEYKRTIEGLEAAGIEIVETQMPATLAYQPTRLAVAREDWLLMRMLQSRLSDMKVIMRAAILKRAFPA